MTVLTACPEGTDLPAWAFVVVMIAMLALVGWLLR